MLRKKRERERKKGKKERKREEKGKKKGKEKKGRIKKRGGGVVLLSTLRGKLVKYPEGSYYTEGSLTV